MEASMKDGKFVNDDGDILDNQDTVLSLHHRCLMWSEIVLERLVSNVPNLMIVV